MKPSAKLALSEIALFGILGGLTFAAKLVMAALPNIEPVSLMVMLFAATFGKKAIYPISVYIAMEILYFGLGTWNICYLYVWLILAAGALLLRKSREKLAFALLSAVFGLCFGALCGIVDIFIGGFAYAASKWVSGIPFDLLHCGGNFAIALIMFKPLRTAMEKLYAQMKR
jgi:energy-coupling factor transport system substrate-specific component